MASKSLFDFIEKTKSIPVETKQIFLYPKEVDSPAKIIKPIIVAGNTYEVSIE